jgi:23S rRNA pseudouridine1911/1915/1917 synthase
MEKYQFIIPNNLRNQRVDKALSALMGDISRSTIQKSIKSNNLYINNQIISDSKTIIKENDVVDITVADPEPQNIRPCDIKFEIIYEDDSLIVINKPAGLSTHPGAGNYDNTLVNGLMHYTNNLSDIAGKIRPGIVHRLDKDTSGLMVVAKNNIIHEKLARKIQDRSLLRRYKALVWGMLNPSSGSIEHNIARDNINRKKMTVTKEGGKHAVTFYSTDQIFLGGKISLVTCKLQTGRTHQIRVHLSHVGHSVVGDQTYGHNSRKIAGLAPPIQEPLTNFKRQALCSYYLAFNHPVTDQFVEFEIDLPEDMQELVRALSTI